jgi:hypothetical protein
MPAGLRLRFADILPYSGFNECIALYRQFARRVSKVGCRHNKIDSQQNDQECL